MNTKKLTRLTSLLESLANTSFKKVLPVHGKFSSFLRIQQLKRIVIGSVLICLSFEAMADGLSYRIRSVSNGKILAPLNNTATAYDPLVITSPVNETSISNIQRWRLEPSKAAGATPDEVQLVNEGSGLCADATTATLILSMCTNAAGQSFIRTSSTSGSYTLKPHGYGQCVDVTASGTDDNTPVVRYGCTGNNNQNWLLEADTRPYNIRSVSSGKLLTPLNNSTNESTNLVIATASDSVVTSIGQQWHLKPSHIAGEVRLIHEASNFCADISATGTNMMIYRCTNSDSQSFIRTKNTSGSYTLKPHSSGQCVDVTGSGTIDNTLVIQYGCTDNANQSWQFEALAANEELYQISVVNSNRVLTPRRNEIAAWTPLEIGNETASATQVWWIKPSSFAGEYQLIDAVSGLCADVNQVSGSQYGQLMLYPCSGAANQSFQIKDNNNQTFQYPLNESKTYTLTVHSSNACVDVSGNASWYGTPVKQQSCNNTDNQKWRLNRKLGYLNNVLFSELILGVGTDNKLYKREIFDDAWHRIGDNGLISAVATMKDGTILGIGADYLLWTLASIDGKSWNKVQYQNSKIMHDVTVMSNGTILGVGEDDQLLYKRNSLSDPWVRVGDNGKLLAVSVMNNGTVLGVGTDQFLWTLPSIGGGSWTKVEQQNQNLAAVLNIIDVQAMSDGRILGVGNNREIYIRKDLSSWWEYQKGSQSVKSVAMYTRKFPKRGYFPIIASDKVNLDCFGGVGSECRGANDPWGNILVPPATTISDSNGRGFWLELGVSIGSITHDNCCIVYSHGDHCGQTPATTQCAAEYARATNDLLSGNQWKARFVSNIPHETNDLLDRGRRYKVPDDSNLKVLKESDATYRYELRAPAGIQVQSADEAGFCASGRTEVAWNGAIRCL